MTGISLRYGSLSLSLFGFFFVWNWIGILGFLLGLLGLLKFGFVEVLVQFVFFFLGSLFNFLGDGFVARTLSMCVIKLIYFAIGTLWWVLLSMVNDIFDCILSGTSYFTGI